MGKNPENMIYSQLLNSVETLRGRAWKKIIDNNLSIIKAARKIGIAIPTLRNFLIHDKTIMLKTILKIGNWLEKKEI